MAKSGLVFIGSTILLAVNAFYMRLISMVSSKISVLLQTLKLNLNTNSPALMSPSGEEFET
jgi:hypothetical protein